MTSGSELVSYALLMLVTSSLNCRVFPDIGCLPVFPYPFSGGMVTSLVSLTFIPTSASSNPGIT